jgi:hypothetical protein
MFLIACSTSAGGTVLFTLVGLFFLWCLVPSAKAAARLVVLRRIIVTRPLLRELHPEMALDCAVQTAKMRP